ncbi:hypothetical protein [Spirosoma lituiforme]
MPFYLALSSQAVDRTMSGRSLKWIRFRDSVANRLILLILTKEGYEEANDDRWR